MSKKIDKEVRGRGRRPMIVSKEYQSGEPE
jgi:hypothetical protein